MLGGGADSWNVRDSHMMETLERLMAFHGPDAKAIIWEHNTHIGDARATDMAANGMHNVGQLARQRHETDGVVLIGFSTYRGSVIAGDEWDAPMRRMDVPPGQNGSWEDVLHRAVGADSLLLLDQFREDIQFAEPRGHRAIGVVYHPDYEHWGNYVPTRLSQRYDALLYLDKTRALHPLHLEPHDRGEPPDTYPWAM